MKYKGFMKENPSVRAQGAQMTDDGWSDSRASLGPRESEKPQMEAPALWGGLSARSGAAGRA